MQFSIDQTAVGLSGLLATARGYAAMAFGLSLTLINLVAGFVIGYSYRVATGSATLTGSAASAARLSDEKME
jgi:uncharacterized protein (UPF0333 family)